MTIEWIRPARHERSDAIRAVDVASHYATVYMIGSSRKHGVRNGVVYGAVPSRRAMYAYHTKAHAVVVRVMPSEREVSDAN
jgi:hypothetical protein